MRLTHQKGLSLLWTAVTAGVLALAGMTALMSARHERNYFAEAWTKLTRTEAGKAIRQTQQNAGNAVKAEASAIRKCIIDGRTVYSNVDCGPDNATGQTVRIHDTNGFEAPKAPTAPAPEGAPSARERMIEKAVQR